VVGLAGLALVGLTACGSSGAPRTSAASAVGATAAPAQSLLASALHNAVSSRGVRETAKGRGGGVTLAMVNDIGPTSGRQAIDANGGRSVVIVTGGHAYFRGDATALASYYRFPIAVAREYAGKWISIAPGDAGFGQVSGAVTLASDFSQIAITGPLTARPVTMPDGRRAVAISGTAKGLTGTPLRATLDVTATDTTLPLEFREGNGSVSELVTWSRWGQPVAFSAPSGATPISDLGSPPGAGGQPQPPTRV